MKEESSRLGLKILSVVLAIGLWFTVNLDRQSNQSQRQVDASVSYNTPQHLVLMEGISSVKVGLQGDEDAITTLNPQMVGVLLDLSDAEAGTMEVRLGPENVFSPKDVEIVSVEPSIISLEFDVREQLQLPVREVLAGEPAAGARVGSRTVRPDLVTVNGPKSVLDTTRSLNTEPLDLNGHALTFEENVAIQVPHPLVSIQPTRVTVRVELELETPDVPGLSSASAGNS